MENKIKDKPRFKAAKEIETDFKSAYSKFLGGLVKFALQNVQLQSNTGTTPGN
jgi:hypothetical protein